MKVFLSHTSKDKPKVEALARALAAEGFDPWLDKWEILGGDDIVQKINQGLAECDAGLIVYSEHTADSRWVTAESSFLTLMSVENGRKLIPVKIGDDAPVPPLLETRLWRRIEDVQGIADALLNRSGKPAIKPRRAADPQITIRLRTTDSAGSFTVEVAQTAPTARVLGSTSTPHAGLSAPLQRHLATFRAGFGAAALRDAGGESGRGLEAAMREFGQMLGALCLPGDSGAAVAALIDPLPVGAWLDIAIEADGTDLLGLPFEAMRLPDGRLLAQQPGVAMWRRPAGLHQAMPEALAGPLKVLVAVGAPDEGTTNAVVLDQERELQNLLDAVEETNRQDNAQVRFLEVGSPQAIGEAVARDAFHVLHLSCHGRPGLLELEDEDGHAVQVTPATLLAALREPGRPLPLVLLNTCHGGVLASDGTASFAEALLRAGVPAVLAMQTSVSDHYATALARHFYDYLTRGEHLRPSSALASARRALEDQRQQAIQRGDASHPCTPEYATAALYLAGDADRPLADFGRDRVPLARRPQHDAVRGQVPMLRQDDLIGRRRVMRQTLRALRQPAGRTAGVVLTGIGGVGKSAVAGRVMQRLLEDGWAVAVHTGRLMLAPMAAQVGRELAGVQGHDTRGHALAAALQQSGVPDEERLPLLLQTLRECRVLLVLDDFEQNLTTGGERFHDPDTRDLLRALAESAHAGRLLLTCRHPVPGVASLLTEQTVGPLSAAEVRKLVLRLDGLHALAASELTTALKLIGGHPRMLELLDALLRRGQGRLKHVSTRLDALAERAGVSLKKLTRLRSLDEQLQATLQLGARDVFLDELLALSRGAGTDAALLQLAVSNLSVSAEGLARMLADDPAEPGDLDAAEDAIEDLATLSLVYRDPDTGSAWVHRWTAEGLAQAEAAGHAERCRRAGHYRLWRLENESHALDDAMDDVMEATRNFLAGHAFDEATGIAKVCLRFLTNARQQMTVAGFASEILERLPIQHGDFAVIADTEAKAHIALGVTEKALPRYQSLLAHHEHLAANEPDRADFQRELSVSFDKVGDLHLAFGQGYLARDAFLKALAIRERLASNEPDRTDFQRDLSISFDRMGDLYLALGQGDLARDAFLKSLAIRKRLASNEPDRADFQRDLVISHVRMASISDSAPDAGQWYAAAWQIVANLQAQGRWQPKDDWMKADLAKRAAENGVTVG